MKALEALRSPIFVAYPPSKFAKNLSFVPRRNIILLDCDPLVFLVGLALFFFQVMRNFSPD